MYQGVCAGRFALVGQTAADVRDVMVEGESGILACAPPWFRPKYEPSKRRLTWPNGAIATTYSGDEPEQLRGPQHGGGWFDELAKMRYAADVWSNYLFGLRLGNDPRTLVTTTPRPIPLVRELLKDASTAVTGGSSYENLDNLAPVYRKNVIARYEGTRLGRQELLAQLLDDTPGALWTLGRIDDLRVKPEAVPALERVVVGVDPKSGDAAKADDDAPSETGIVVEGRGVDGHGYTLADRSTSGGPGTWAAEVIRAYQDFKADAVVVERNQGGAMVAHTIRNTPGGARVKIVEVWASRGKVTRAEPIAALYEQGAFHHVGSFAELESQMTTYVPGMKSPDRMDAKVWASSELFPSVVRAPRVAPSGVTKSSDWSRP